MADDDDTQSLRPPAVNSTEARAPVTLRCIHCKARFPRISSVFGSLLWRMPGSLQSEPFSSLFPDQLHPRVNAPCT